MRVTGKSLNASLPSGRLFSPIPHVQGARERAEADHAKADQTRMARDVATMFNGLKALADRHSDRAPLQAIWGIYLTLSINSFRDGRS
jgi:hypothetical protein